ncbi:glycosyltransferase [Breoghania sp.]|uniref:glycosyltransferase n=1 Tax=Breoghania sp. TaxID=2065378 RepID=UPI002AA6BC0A|nr:glycosyltransferase [Breoghania sp.]
MVQLLVGESWGGAERFFVKLAGALEKREIDSKIIIKRDAQRAQDLRDLGVEPVELDFQKGIGDILARRALAREVKAFAPDVVVAWMNRAARRMPSGDFVKVGRLGGYYPLKYYKKCDWLIANTPDLERYIKDGGWPADRVRMLTNFGELEPMAPASRASLDTPEDAFVLLSMGRLHDSKGFDTLISAVAKVDGAYLWLAGAGELDATLRQQAEAAGISDRVRFLGWRNDQAALLQGADVCVVPSRHEPLSNVVLEAWSLSCPVVAAASEGPGWLIDHGENGLLSPVDDINALALNIQAMKDAPDDARRLAEGGHAKWQKAFSVDAITNQFIDFFAEISRKSA